MRAHWLIATTVLFGCKLDPLVDDLPGASVHILPAGATVPKVADSAELKNQVELNDGIDDLTLLVTWGGVVMRGTGWSEDAQVRYWAFGAASRAPCPMYLFYRDTGAGLVPLDHPPLIKVLPGDPGYNHMHNIWRVVVTPVYAGELITTSEALNDAIELGLVNPPENTTTFTSGMIVVPNTKLEVGGGNPDAEPMQVYARGHIAEMFRFGGIRNLQPGGGIVPSLNVAFLREQTKATYDVTRPIFQATVPPAGQTPPPFPGRPTYSPFSAVVNVDLASGISATDITQDSDLFTRNAAGVIIATKPEVLLFTVTTTTLVLQMQFTDGEP